MCVCVYIYICMYVVYVNVLFHLLSFRTLLFGFFPPRESVVGIPIFIYFLLYKGRLGNTIFL